MEVRPDAEIWFVTFVTHCSRVSERMVHFGVTNREGEGLTPLVLSAREQLLAARSFFETADRHGFHFLALNVLPDHVHALIPAEDQKRLGSFVGKLKTYSAQAINAHRGCQGSTVWAQKFHRVRVDSPRALVNIYAYISENHLKHQKEWGERIVEAYERNLRPIIAARCPPP